MWTGLTELVEGLAASPWLPLAVFAFALLDSVFPVVPSESAVIVGGVAAGFGDQSLLLVFIAATLGALSGDIIAYGIGRSANAWLRRRSPRARGRLMWASRQLRRRGARLLVTARFVPFGRTTVTFASGATRQPFARYVALVAVAGVLWAVYGAGLGYVFGEVFADRHLVAFALALGVAVGVNAAAEVVRYGRSRIATDPGSEPHRERIAA